jgi:hypothetical protein
MKLLRMLQRLIHGRDALPTPKATRNRPKPQELFDTVSRIMASPISRREAIKAVIVGLAGVALLSIGIEPAWAVTDCTCGGIPIPQGNACCKTGGSEVLYDPVQGCCTPTGVQQKYPIVNLQNCPNRVAHPGFVPVPNGCGAQGGIQFPGTWGNAQFTPCCNTHDICYGTCNSGKANCDSAFLTCLQDACRNAYPGSGLVESAKRNACLGVANAYYQGVNHGGQSAYDSAQREACDCCPGDQPCCPQDRVMCGNTCCDPGQTCVNGQCTSSCSSPGTCGGPYGSCAGGCICHQTTEGGTCVDGSTPCAGLSGCSSSSDCGPGFACFTNSCCGQNVCAPICGGSSGQSAPQSGELTITGYAP